MMDLSFYKGKKVFITGHTGFKGSWICQMLLNAGAEVTGYALENVSDPDLFSALHLAESMNSIIGDVRNYEGLYQALKDNRPEIVIHMAAQPIVRESYVNPLYTYETNVMGTANVLEAVRNTDMVRSLINVTTDKVYRNREWIWGYRENEELDGYDPYSNSKSCSELVTAGYRRSFFGERNVAISTLRAGNVIGGGDFAKDRIVPDCVRAAEAGKKIILRNPNAVRPYQHVLEPVSVYLHVAQKQYEDKSLEGAYNIGPEESNCITTGEIATLFCRKWEELSGRQQKWIAQGDGGPHEANLLKLDCTKLKTTFDWKPVWNIEQAVAETTEWYYRCAEGEDMRLFTTEQIERYLMNEK